MKYIALKRFGGGTRLRERYGSGPARFIAQGTVIPADGFNSRGHIADLEGMRLIEPYDPKKSYTTQADKEASKSRPDRSKKAKA